MILILLTFWLSGTAHAATTSIDDTNAPTVRARELRDFIQKEKPAFKQRENEKKDLIEQLDRLNADQNQIRDRIGTILSSQQELEMALQNLSSEVKKQKEREIYEKERLLLLFKVVYKIKKDGLVRFLAYGGNLTNVGARVRVLYRTVRSHSLLTRQLQERAIRLAESEKKLVSIQENADETLGELHEQEGLLKDLLDKKHKMISLLDKKQTHYQQAVKEYKQVSKQLRALFENFESHRSGEDGSFPGRGSLPLPLDSGRVVKNFGKSVSQRFGTVTYQKGIEFEAAHNSPVKAVLPGTVEFEGWVKGLGNVVILHHGGGFYSLSGHLFKSTKPQGAKVEQGDTIGLVGDTGTSDKPSLYFEFRENSRAVDPARYFSALSLRNLTMEKSTPEDLKVATD